MKCQQCGGTLEKIARGGEYFFSLCRHCKIPYDSSGTRLFDGPELASFFNPLKAARSVTKTHHTDASPVARTALEVALIQNLTEAYASGLKDGVLLAYSQDYQKGEPMEKVGVAKQELVKELQDKFQTLVDKKHSGASLSKEATAQIDTEMNAIKAKLDELQSGQ